MRRVQALLVIVLLVAEVVWLALQPLQRPGPGGGARAILSSTQAEGMTALVEQEAHMITLRLRGHQAGAEPRLTVMAGDRDLTGYLRFREDGETETSVRLSYAGVNMFPARALTYTWELDGRQVTGEHMYVHPNFPFQWRRELIGPFVYYHTGTMTEAMAGQWGAFYANLAGFLGLEPVERTIYVLPDVDALQKALGGDVKERKVAGLWIEPLDAVLLSTDYHPIVLRKIVYHELAHAFLANRNSSWWEEGIATWVEGEMIRRHGAWDGDLIFPERFEALQRVMASDGTYLMRANNSQSPPLDPYTVGFSLFLYLEDRFGEEAIVRLAGAASERPGAEAVRAVLGEELDHLEAGWQEFIRNGGHLKVLRGQ